jgi:hypothetical protein
MGKITEIKFVGQPVFKQIMNLVNKVDIQGLIKKHNSDYYYKAFKTRTQLFTMLFGILSRCDSMTEICEGLRALDGKLNHLWGWIRPQPKVPHAMVCVIGTASFLKTCILVW